MILYLFTSPGASNSGAKSYSRFRRRWRKRRRIDDVHYPLQYRDDGRFVNIEPLFQFLFQGSELPGQFTLVAQERSHSQKRADNKHAHLDGPRTIENIGAMMAPCSVTA